MFPPSQGPIRRPVVIYFGAVVVPTLVILTLGVIATIHQHTALETLRSRSRRLAESRLNDEVDRLVLEDARRALQDVKLRELVPQAVSTDFGTVDAGGSVVYPRLEPPLPGEVHDVVAAADAEAGTLFTRAEAMALGGRHLEAASIYRRIQASARPDRVIGLALLGEGRSRLAAGDRSGATRAWTTLATAFPDTYSLSGRPMALLAAEELSERIQQVVWLPENRGLLFTRMQASQATGRPSQEAAVWVVDLPTRTTRHVGISMDGLRNMAITSDGRRLAFTAGWPAREPWVLENFLPSPRPAGLRR